MKTQSQYQREDRLANGWTKNQISNLAQLCVHKFMLLLYIYHLQLAIYSVICVFSKSQNEGALRQNSYQMTEKFLHCFTLVQHSCVDLTDGEIDL